MNDMRKNSAVDYAALVEEREQEFLKFFRLMDSDRQTTVFNTLQGLVFTGERIDNRTAN